MAVGCRLQLAACLFFLRILSLTACKPCPRLTAAAFYEVTSIADAVALWKTMQEKGQVASAAAGGAAEEEVEDEAGNVYSRKVCRNAV